LPLLVAHFSGVWRTLIRNSIESVPLSEVNKLLKVRNIIPLTLQTRPAKWITLMLKYQAFSVTWPELLDSFQFRNASLDWDKLCTKTGRLYALAIPETTCMLYSSSISGASYQRFPNPMDIHEHTRNS
jgi:hypothetical protein